MKGKFNDADLLFCCTGCLAIYEFIHKDGLESFYKRRDGWQPGIQLIQEVDLSLLRKAVVTDDDGLFMIALSVGGIRCASCVWLIEKVLEKTEGLHDVKINYATYKAVIRWDGERLDLEHIVKRIQQFGYTPHPYDPNIIQETEFRSLLIRFGTASFFAMQLMTYSLALYAGYFQGMNPTLRFTMKIVAGLLATPVLFYSGWPFIRGALAGLRSFRFTMDFLIAMGAGSAYFLSVFQTFNNGEVYYDTAVMIITLILLGRLIETGARGRASDALKRLMSLAPDQVRLVHDRDTPSKNTMIPTASIRIGQFYSILPGEKIPIDGIVVEGVSEVDESMLSGESLPVPKKEKNIIRGGTINRFGHLLAQVSTDYDNTMLARIIRSVEDAQERQAPVQAFADKLVSVFVPVVMGLSAIAFFFTISLHSFSDGVIRAVSVLIVACPCSMGLATPLAILIGTGISASKGILVKGGDIMEYAQTIKAVVLDKTGTLTTGTMTLKKVIPFTEKFNEEQCLKIAASLEAQSEHAVADAICKGAKGMDLHKVMQTRIFPGKGIQGIISNQAYQMGSARLMKEAGFDHSALSDSKNNSATLVYLSDESGILACFIISDSLRDGAAETVSALKKLGIRVFLVSGDQQGAVADIARLTGIEDYRFGCLPDEKVRFIEALKQKENIKVAMVGDGINDAPALMTSDVGIAVAKGTDIAMESADIVLLREDLYLIYKSFDISKKTFKTIKLNLVWALGYNMLVLPAAVLGFLHPIFCAGAMAASSLCVVFNSLWLKKRGGV